MTTLMLLGMAEFSCWLLWWGHAFFVGHCGHLN